MKIAPSLLYPVQVADKTAKVIVKHDHQSKASFGFSPIGQQLEDTFNLSTNSFMSSQQH